jgi:hypothetical protein
VTMETQQETNKPAISFDEPEQSAEIGQLAEALAASQDEMGNAEADSFNPHFKSNYADLASVRDASRPLFKHKLALTQQLLSRSDGAYGVRTMLAHASGEWMASRAWMHPERGGPQAAGAVITYLRRFMWAAALGIAQEDNDGDAGTLQRRAETSNGNGQAQPKPEPTPPAGPWRAQGDDGTLILDGEVEDFDKLIKQLSWKPNFVGMFLQRRFGIPDAAVRRLTRQQFKVVAKLLTANGLGKEKYEVALKEAIEAGQVKP